MVVIVVGVGVAAAAGVTGVAVVAPSDVVIASK